jgi:hypothetical protein
MFAGSTERAPGAIEIFFYFFKSGPPRSIFQNGGNWITGRPDQSLLTSRLVDAPQALEIAPVCRKHRTPSERS